MILAKAHSMTIIDTGSNINQLEESKLKTHDPFCPSSSLHIIETSVESSNADLNHEAFIRKMQLQYFDALEDSLDEDWSFIPTGVIAHKLSIVPRRKIV